MKPLLEEKDLLNPEEAISLYGMSRRKFYRLISEGRDLPFLAYYKTRKLIIRNEFDNYLRFHPELKEALKNGKKPLCQKERFKTSCFAQRRIGKS